MHAFSPFQYGMRFSRLTPNIWDLTQYSSTVQNSSSPIQLVNDDCSLYNSLNTGEEMTTQETPQKEIISIPYEICVLQRRFLKEHLNVIPIKG